MLFTSWSKPAAADGYYRAETTLGLAADTDWPAIVGEGAPLRWPTMSDIQTALPKVLSTLWVAQPTRRAGLERSLAQAGDAFAAELNLTSAWTRRRRTGMPTQWVPADLPAGEWWLHHVSRHLEPHLHCHYLLPLRGRTELGERALMRNILHAGRYGAAARAATVIANHLRSEGFETSATGHYGWLTLRAGPPDSDIGQLHALAARWSTGHRARQRALAAEAAQRESLSSDAVRKLDRLVVDRSARPDWQGVAYDRRYGQLLDDHWQREVAITKDRMRPPATETSWMVGLRTDRLYEAASVSDSRTDLRNLRWRAWQLACHDPDLPDTDAQRAAVVDEVVTETLEHRPIYAIGEVEDRAEPHAERAQTVGRGLVSILWLAAASRLRQALAANDRQTFPRLMLTAGRDDARVYQPADGFDNHTPPDETWAAALRGRISALCAPGGAVQSQLLTSLRRERTAYLAPPQGLDAAGPHAWIESHNPLLAADPRRAAPPDGRPGLCVIAAQRRSDVELTDMAERWRAGGWDVLLVVDSEDLAQPWETRSEALLWGRRSDHAAVLECCDMGDDPAAAYGRRHHMFAKLSTGRESFWQSELNAHVTQTDHTATGIAERLDALRAIQQPITVIAPAPVAGALDPARWPQATWHEPAAMLRDDNPADGRTLGHVVYALETNARQLTSVRSLLLKCKQLSTHLSVVSPWDADTTRTWMQDLRLATPEQRDTISDRGWERLQEPEQLRALREPGELHERLTGRVRY